MVYLRELGVAGGQGGRRQRLAGVADGRQPKGRAVVGRDGAEGAEDEAGVERLLSAEELDGEVFLGLRASSA